MHTIYSKKCHLPPMKAPLSEIINAVDQFIQGRRDYLQELIPGLMIDLNNKKPLIIDKLRNALIMSPTLRRAAQNSGLSLQQHLISIEPYLNSICDFAMPLIERQIQQQLAVDKYLFQGDPNDLLNLIPSIMQDVSNNKDLVIRNVRATVIASSKLRSFIKDEMLNNISLFNIDDLTNIDMSPSQYLDKIAPYLNAISNLVGSCIDQQLQSSAQYTPSFRL